MKLFELVAREMFRFEHPRTSWQKHPNYKQQQQQHSYEMEAKVLLHRIGEWSGQTIDREMVALPPVIGEPRSAPGKIDG